MMALKVPFEYSDIPRVQASLLVYLITLRDGDFLRSFCWYISSGQMNPNMIWNGEAVGTLWSDAAKPLDFLAQTKFYCQKMLNFSNQSHHHRQIIAEGKKLTCEPRKDFESLPLHPISKPKPKPTENLHRNENCIFNTDPKKTQSSVSKIGEFLNRGDLWYAEVQLPFV